MDKFCQGNGVVNQTFSVLHVDSDMLMRKILKKTVPDNFFRLDSAADGREAFRLLDQNQYDIVITEMHMHFANGYEIVNRILCNSPRSTVIITSNMSFFHIRDGLDIPRENYFKKPLVIGKLMERIKAVLVPKYEPINGSALEKLCYEEVQIPVPAFTDDEVFSAVKGRVTSVMGVPIEMAVPEETSPYYTWAAEPEKVEVTAELPVSIPGEEIVIRRPVPIADPAISGKRWW